MCAVKVINIAFQSELFLCAWRYGAGFAIRHYLPDYLSLLCGATFPTMFLVYMLILPMPHEDLKQNFATARWKRILKIDFRTIAALLLLAHPKFNSRILKNRLLVYICMEACNYSTQHNNLLKTY